MNYYDHHIGDYDSDTAHLSWLEDMAYTRLIRMYYRTEKPIPAEITRVCRLVRASSEDECEAVRVVLNEFFTLEEDGWHQKRCDEEIAKVQAKSSKAKQSAALRWQSERNANALPTQSEGNAPNNQYPITNKPSSAPAGAEFEEFWRLYPRKKSKGSAERAWAKLKPNEQLIAVILDAVERAKTSAEWTKDQGQFIPYPATWLNARGWLDELTPAQPKVRVLV